MAKFSDKVLTWFDQNGRKDLPWQHPVSAYGVWISEIMLQQTQVATVIPYYERFIENFPDVTTLAKAELDEVLHQWTGLGYYARARNLHKAARAIVEEFGGELPDKVDKLCQLPGIGRSTAGAIAAIAYSQHAPILDGNVKRVLTRYHGIAGWPEQSHVKNQLWELAESLTPDSRISDYTQAIMDLGATVCKRSNPACGDCPVSTECVAFTTGSVDEFPGRKPKKTLPVKQVAMFMLQNENNEVLLQKRPPTGIWGSLWSFPESGKGRELPTFVDTSVKVKSSSTWPQLRHTFSHYHLDITPVHELVTSSDNAVMDTDSWLWYPLHRPSQVGLAAPVKNLLEQLANQSN